MRMHRFHFIPAVLLALAGCAADVPDKTEGAAPAAASSELQLGDSGPAVRELHEFLTTYGYFPSDALAERYPGYQAHVLEHPADPAIFDEVTERGVRAYQRFNGLPVSGIADAETLARMKAPRCGEPDVLPADGEKWSVQRVNWGSAGQPCAMSVRSDGRMQVTYSIATTDAATWNALGIPFTQAQYRTAIQQSLLVWMLGTSIGPTEVSSNACVRFAIPENLPAGVVGREDVRTSSGFSTIRISKNVIWALTPPVPDNGADLVETLAHEFGHALLLAHSSVSDSATLAGPLMVAVGTWGSSHRKAEADDLTAAHVSFRRTTAQILGISAADASPDGSIWGLDTTFRTRGFGIWNNVGGTWHRLNDGSEAVAIAVDGSGVVWHVNSDGNVWRRSQAGEGGFWVNVPVPVPLFSIAGGGNSTTGPVVWALSRAIAGGRNFDRNVFRFDPGTGTFVQAAAAAKALAVNRAGTMFHVNEFGEMWASTTEGGWMRFRGSLTGGDPLWAEVHGGKDTAGQLFAVDIGGRGFVLNFQIGNDLPGTSSDTPQERRWAPFDPAARFQTLFSDKNAQVWTLTNSNLSMSR